MGLLVDSVCLRRCPHSHCNTPMHTPLHSQRCSGCATAPEFAFGVRTALSCEGEAAILLPWHAEPNCNVSPPADCSDPLLSLQVISLCVGGFPLPWGAPYAPYDSIHQTVCG
eukprot:GGOE01026390.1.p4 GENE.GGOE01026390.1~~GGOE01026390.1.p4  ORF type:complete len:112 (-),score=5.85 GGOE01026390.1:242-577(-)